MCNKFYGQWQVLSWMLGLLWCIHAHAQNIAPMPPAPESRLLADMLRLDAERALAAELAKSSELATSSTLPQIESTQEIFEPAQDAVALSAIYGVGKRLYADVLVQGQVVTYAAGRVQAIRAAQSQPIYRLRAIQLPCVQLDRQGNALLTPAPTLELCLGAKP